MRRAPSWPHQPAIGNMSAAPAYGRELVQARTAGAPVNVFLYCGERAWQFAQGRPPGGRLVIPPDADWRSLDWSCTRGLELVVVARGWDQDELDELGRHLVLQGVQLAVGLLVERDGHLANVTPTYYRPAHRRAAA